VRPEALEALRIDREDLLARDFPLLEAAEPSAEELSAEAEMLAGGKPGLEIFGDTPEASEEPSEGL